MGPLTYASADCQAPIGTVGPNVGSQLWATLPNGLIQLNGTNFCLDAGVSRYALILGPSAQCCGLTGPVDGGGQ